MCYIYTLVYRGRESTHSTHTAAQKSIQKNASLKDISLHREMIEKKSSKNFKVIACFIFSKHSKAKEIKIIN